MAAPRFVDSFWGDNGFQVIEKRLDQGMKSSDLLTYYIGERANIEKLYAEKLQRLIRNTKEMSEVGSSRAAWLALKGETDNLSSVHLDFASQLVQQIGLPMTKFKEDQKKLRRQYLGDAYKLNKEMSKMKDYLGRVRDKYQKLSRDAEAQEAVVAQLKASGAKQKDINKAIAKLQSLSKQSIAHEREYQECVTKLASFQVEWVEKISGILEFLQIQEEQRIENMRESLVRFVEVQDAVAPFLGEACKRMQTAVAQIDKSVDIQEFIQQYGTGSQKPAAPVFEPFQRANAAAPPALLQQQQAAAAAVVPPQGAAFPAGAGGAGGAAPPPAARPPPRRFKVRALYDYVGQDATELDFLANDIIEIVDQDESGWWTGVLEGRQGLLPSNYCEEL